MKDFYNIIGLTVNLVTISNVKSETINLCDQNVNCLNGKQLTLTNGQNSFDFKGCETDIVKLKLLPESDVNIKSLEVNDRNRIIYHTGSLESLKDVEIFSLTNTPKVTVDVEDTNGLEITYSCQKPIEENGNFEYENGTIDKILDPLTNLQYTLTSEDIYHVDVALQTLNPTASFAAVSLGNGKYAVGFSKMNLAIPSSNANFGEESSPHDVKIVSNNLAVPSDKLTMKYYLGERATTSTLPTTTTTQTQVTEDQITTMYAIAVEEVKFVNQHLESFKTKTWNIMKEACPDLPDRNLIHYNQPYKCRQQCGLSNEGDRGCVMVGMHLEDIPESVYCENIKGQTRLQYFKNKLEGMTGELKNEFDAKRVAVDNCNAITWSTDWVWLSIGLVGGVLLLTVAIMLGKRCGRGFRSGSTPVQDSEKYYDEIDDKPRRYQRSNQAFIEDSEA